MDNKFEAKLEVTGAAALVMVLTSIYGLASLIADFIKVVTQ